MSINEEDLKSLLKKLIERDAPYNSAPNANVRKPKLAFKLYVQFLILSILRPLYFWLDKKTAEAQRIINRREAERIAEKLFQERTPERERKLRQLQADLNQVRNDKEALRRMMTCGHRKGGRGKRNRAIHADYNIWMHTFPNGQLTVRCLNGCGKEWKPQDADWDEAVRMMKETSNTATSSEVRLVGVPLSKARNEPPRTNTFLYQDEQVNAVKEDDGKYGPVIVVGDDRLSHDVKVVFQDADGPNSLS